MKKTPNVLNILFDPDTWIVVALVLIALIIHRIEVETPFTSTRKVGAAARSVIQLMPERGSHGSAAVVKAEPLSEGVWLLTLVTADHMVADQDETAHALLANGAEVPFEVLDRDSDIDAAVITIRSPIFVKALPIRDGTPFLAEPAFTLGYGGAYGSLWIGCGVICTDSLTTAPIIYGDSGGAVLDGQGRLLGTIKNIEVMNQVTEPFGSVVRVPIAHHAGFVSSAALLSRFGTKIR